MSRPPLYKFRLYVAGEAQNSVQATSNLLVLCRTHLAERHEIEMIDVLREPRLALANGILMTPTLVKLAPGPAVRIVGTLAQTDTVMQALGLALLVA
jgi:circadian clock protein KaiB